jgi:DNA replication ATP-dependent helicase Dna2
MVRSQRWLFFGDHRQLPPVVTAEHRDRGACASIFAHLHAHYGSVLLDTSYRMNAGVCSIVSDTFYGGRLRADAAAALRRLPFVPGGRLDEVLDPEHAVVWLRVDHRQPGSRSQEEANAVADVVEDLVRQHGVAAPDIAVIAPFRAQARLLRSALQRRALPGQERLLVDTVERMQGQEREVVVISLTAGDPDEVRGRGAFHLSENRLNVALSRARTKVVLVASAHSFRALPSDIEALRTASRCRELRDRLFAVDLTRVYAGRTSGA